MGADGKLAWVNRAGAEYAGLSVRELEADGSAVVHPDDMPSVEAWLEQAHDAGERLNYERRIRRLDGRDRWMGVQAGPVRDVDGADRFEFSELSDQRPESPVRELLDGIRHALAREELRLRYQPVFDLADRSIRGLEVLLRWEHPSRTVLTPEMFLPAARRTGAITAIGRWVLEQSLSQLEQWNGELERAAPLRLFINLSARELADPSLVDALAGVLERARVRPEQLAVDVSDAALIEVYGAAWRSVVGLRELGVAIVLDRLGTTFSSLAHLEQLPIDVVKLDRSCVAGLPDDPRDRATVKAALGVAEARGLATIACGVETERQVQTLAGLGCTAAQGFLFAEPRAARAVTKLLRWRGETSSRAAS
jgi:PAS domain S-box-containing protein